MIQTPDKCLFITPLFETELYKTFIFAESALNALWKGN